MTRKSNKFPKKPKLVEGYDGNYKFSCDCNYCRLDRYCREVKDEAAYLAYLVAEERMLSNFIDILKKEGWTNKGLDGSKDKNLAFYLIDLDDTRCIIGSIIRDKTTKLVLKDSQNMEVR